MAAGIHRQFAKIFDAMECEIIRIVAVVGAAVRVVERRPANGDDVICLELPIDILKAVFRLIRVI